MTCGYVCPQCEGSGFLENGDPCDYCNKPIEPTIDENKEEIS